MKQKGIRSLSKRLGFGFISKKVKAFLTRDKSVLVASSIFAFVLVLAIGLMLGFSRGLKYNSSEAVLAENSSTSQDCNFYYGHESIWDLFLCNLNKDPAGRSGGSTTVTSGGGALEPRGGGSAISPSAPDPTSQEQCVSTGTKQCIVVGGEPAGKGTEVEEFSCKNSTGQNYVDFRQTGQQCTLPVDPPVVTNTTTLPVIPSIPSQPPSVGSSTPTYTYNPAVPSSAPSTQGGAGSSTTTSTSAQQGTTTTPAPTSTNPSTSTQQPVVLPPTPNPNQPLAPFPIDPNINSDEYKAEMFLRACLAGSPVDCSILKQTYPNTFAAQQLRDQVYNLDYDCFYGYNDSACQRVCEIDAGSSACVKEPLPEKDCGFFGVKCLASAIKDKIWDPAVESFNNAIDEAEKYIQDKMQNPDPQSDKYTPEQMAEETRICQNMYGVNEALCTQTFSNSEANKIMDLLGQKQACLRDGDINSPNCTGFVTGCRSANLGYLCPATATELFPGESYAETVQRHIDSNLGLLNPPSYTYSPATTQGLPPGRTINVPTRTRP